MKIVINRCYGGFDLSKKAQDAIFVRKIGKHPVWYYKSVKDTIDIGRIIYLRACCLEEAQCRTGSTLLFGPRAFSEDVGERIDEADGEVWDKEIDARDLPRDDLDLIAVVEAMGDEAKTELSRPEIREIPDGSFWKIDNYDGIETLYWSKSKIESC